MLTSNRSWLVAPILFLICAVALVATWCAIPVETLNPLFDNKGHSPIELITLGYFALIIPLVWICPPFAGSARRKAFWCAIATLLVIMAIVRETDIHKMLFASIWPEVDSSFKGTVFKMKFLRAHDIPLVPKLFVGVFFAVFFVVVLIPFVYYIIPLVKGIFKLDGVCWTWAVFGGSSVMVLVVDRIPAMLRHAGFDGPLLDKHTGSVAALMRVFEEGGEMMMALFALLAVLQAYLRLRVNDTRNVIQAA